MLAQSEEEKEWPMASWTVCQGALWQIWGSGVDHAQTKEVHQGDDPLNAGMRMHFDLSTVFRLVGSYTFHAFIGY